MSHCAAKGADIKKMKAAATTMAGNSFAFIQSLLYRDYITSSFSSRRFEFTNTVSRVPEARRYFLIGEDIEWPARWGEKILARLIRSLAQFAEVRLSEPGSRTMVRKGAVPR